MRVSQKLFIFLVGVSFLYIAQDSHAQRLWGENGVKIFQADSFELTGSGYSISGGVKAYLANIGARGYIEIRLDRQGNFLESVSLPELISGCEVTAHPVEDGRLLQIVQDHQFKIMKVSHDMQIVWEYELENNIEYLNSYLIPVDEKTIVVMETDNGVRNTTINFLDEEGNLSSSELLFDNSGMTQTSYTNLEDGDILFSFKDWSRPQEDVVQVICSSENETVEIVPIDIPNEFVNRILCVGNHTAIVYVNDENECFISLYSMQGDQVSQFYLGIRRQQSIGLRSAGNDRLWVTGNFYDSGDILIPFEYTGESLIPCLADFAIPLTVSLIGLDDGGILGIAGRRYQRYSREGDLIWNIENYTDLSLNLNGIQSEDLYLSLDSERPFLTKLNLEEGNIIGEELLRVPVNIQRPDTVLCASNQNGNTWVVWSTSDQNNQPEEDMQNWFVQKLDYSGNSFFQNPVQLPQIAESKQSKIKLESTDSGGLWVAGEMLVELSGEGEILDQIILDFDEGFIAVDHLEYFGDNLPMPLIYKNLEGDSPGSFMASIQTDHTVQIHGTRSFDEIITPVNLEENFYVWSYSKASSLRSNFFYYNLQDSGYVNVGAAEDCLPLDMKLIDETIYTLFYEIDEINDSYTYCTGSIYLRTYGFDGSMLNEYFLLNDIPSYWFPPDGYNHLPPVFIAANVSGTIRENDLLIVPEINDDPYQIFNYSLDGDLLRDPVQIDADSMQSIPRFVEKSVEGYFWLHAKYGSILYSDDIQIVDPYYMGGSEYFQDGMYKYTGKTQSPRGDLIVTAIDNRQVFVQRMAGINEFSVSEHQINQPVSLQIQTPYPNPFNSECQITYNLFNSSNVTLTVFDLLGRVVMKVDRGKQIRGEYHYVLDFSKYSSNSYFVEISAGSSSECRKVTLLR
ncbi:T9SS type A sorting domain-containing protein [bacterium]|nr:T9SS type A sorting domain-containing protein [bacterium]